MTDNTQPEALRLAHIFDHPLPPEWPDMVAAAAELRRQHAYCQELETQVIRDCMTHDQNPAEIEHVAGDVSKNGAESNMSTQQPAPATQQAGWKCAPVEPTDAMVQAAHHIDLSYMPGQEGADRAAIYRAMLAAAPQPSLTAQAAECVPAPVQSGLVATMLDALRHAQKVLNHNNLHLECGPVNAAILAARDPAESVLEDAERYQWLRRWKGQEHEPPFTVQHEIDGTLWGGDLDAAIDAARKQGGA